MSRVVQIKGCNGSGKSTIVRQLIASSSDVRQEGVHTVLYDKGWAIIGSYESDSPTSVGCDRIYTVQEVKDAVSRAVVDYPNADVLFEGMMISTIKSTFYDHLMDLKADFDITPLFVILDATPQGCLARLDARGTRKSSLKIQNIIDKCAGIIRHAKTYDQQYVQYINVEFTRERDMLSAFLRVTDSVYQMSYSELLRLDDDEIYARMLGYEDEDSVDNMTLIERRTALYEALLPGETYDYSECYEPQIDVPCLDGYYMDNINGAAMSVYGRDVGYMTDSGNTLSLTIHLWYIDRPLIPMLTEWQQVSSCRSCKGHNGGCPVYAPRLDALKPSVEGLYILVVSLDMAWALKYSSRINPFMPSSWADVVTVSYCNRLLKKLKQNGQYTLGMGKCTGCGKGGSCAVSKGKACKHPTRRSYSMEAVGVDCVSLHQELYGEWMPWLYRGTNKVQYYMTRYAGILSDQISVPAWLEMAVKSDKSYRKTIPDLPDYPLDLMTIPSGAHKGCDLFVYDMDVEDGDE